jgi:hypothetical protein
VRAEELRGRDRPLAAASAGVHDAVEEEDDRGQLGCRIGVRQAAADRAAVADLRVCDEGERVREQRACDGDHR